MFTRILFFVLLLISGLTFSQSFSEYLAKQNNLQSLQSIQKAFNDWSAGKNLNNTKGWKLFKRLEYDQSKWLDGQGQMPDPEVYAKNILNATKFLNASSAKTYSANWIPLGPFNVPEQFDTLGFYGMGRISCMAFHPKDTDTFFVGVAQGGVWKTTNAGQTWTPLTDNGLPILRISDIAIDPLHPDTMYIAVGDFEYIGYSYKTAGRKRNTHYGMGVYKTTNGGQTWTPTGLSFQLTNFDYSLTRKIIINPSNTNQLLAATSSGTWKSLNGGANWTKTLDSLTWDLEQDPTNPNVIFATSGYVNFLQTGSAGILKSTDFGSTWSWLNTGIPKKQAQRIKIAIAPTNNNYIYAVSTSLSNGLEGVYLSKDAGLTWNKQSYSPNILDFGDGSANGGQGFYDLGLAIDPSDEKRIYVGGINIWSSTNEGINWEPISYIYSGRCNLHPDQHFLAFQPNKKTLFVCNDGGIYKTDSLITGSIQLADSINDYIWPTRWKNLSNGLNVRSWYRMGLSKNNPGFMVGGAQDNGSVYRNKNGNWHFVYGGDGMEGLMHPDDTLNFIVSYQYGNFAQTTDGGQSVHPIGVGGGESCEWTTPMVWHPTSADTLYAAYGNVWRSGDGGQSWDKLSSLPNSDQPNSSISSALAVAPSNANYIYVTKRVDYLTSTPAEMWRSMDGGQTWNDITTGLPDSLYFNYIAVSDNDPKMVWVVCGGFSSGVKVFKSMDAGNNWVNISYNLPNLPANCITHHHGTTNNAIYIGMDVGIYYINDNLNTWQPYNTNVPNVLITDLKIHDKEQKIYATTFGRGIWISDLNDTPTGILTYNKKDFELNLFPTITSGEFTISAKGQLSPNLTIEVIDINGKKLFEEKTNVTGKLFTKKYNLNLPGGAYFVCLRNNTQTKATKIIIQ